MYEFDWIFVKAPIGTSFSTQTPRPMTTPSPIVQRSRTDARSPTIAFGPRVVPA